MRSVLFGIHHADGGTYYGMTALVQSSWATMGIRAQYIGFAYTVRTVYNMKNQYLAPIYILVRLL